MVRRSGKEVRVAIAITIVAIILGTIAALSSPEVVSSAFGEWGYRHLVSTDMKVKMINDKMANPSFPLIMMRRSGWSAGVPYAEEMLYCKNVNPLEFVLTGPKGKHEYEAPITWIDSSSFYYMVKGYPIKITVRILEVKDDQVRIAVLAEKVPS